MVTRGVLLLGLLVGCGGGAGGAGGAGGTGGMATGGADAGARPVYFGGDREVRLQVPAGHDPARPAPLVIALHGYGGNPVLSLAYLGIGAWVEEHGVLLLAPEGTFDGAGKAFWNATDACCNLDGAAVDDVAYLGQLVRDVSAAYAVDPKRVFVLGHSNGGYMSYRMACDRAADVAAIVSFSGATWLDAARCAPAAPVSVLHIHGELDANTPYQGDARIPGARGSVARWADYDGCAGAPAEGTPFDLDQQLPGAETLPLSYAGCPAGIGVELWTIRGSSHLPVFAEGDLARRVWAWLEAHPRP